MKSKSAAGILAIIFGEWGIQWFYLGRAGRGVAYLLIWFFTFWTIIVPIIMAIVGFVEGIMLLSMTEAEFNQKYNAIPQQTPVYPQQPLYQQPQQSANQRTQHAAKTSSSSASSNGQLTKTCPYCGEEILEVAKKCKYCGEWLDK